MSGQSSSDSASRRGVRVAFAEQFRSWRRNSGKPLKAVALDLGVSNSTASGWETGAYFPTADNLDAIALYTGIPCCVFICTSKTACPLTAAAKRRSV